MNKLPCFIITLLFFSTTAQAQEWRLRKYYELINLAEMQIVDSSYKPALTFYKEAFLYKKPNNEDLANAFQVAFMIKDTLTAKLLLNELAVKGMHPTYYKNSPQFSAYKMDAVLFEYIRTDYDSLYLISQKELKPFGDSFVKFSEADTKARNDRKINPLLNVDSLDRINEKNLLDQINATAFPTFENTGFWGAFARSHYMEGVCWIVAWHRRPEKSILEDVILEQVHKGNYIPELYAGLWAGRNDDIYGIQLVHIGLASLNDAQISKLNKKRSEIYLEPIQDFIRKSKFQSNDERFMLTCEFFVGFNRAVEKMKKEKERK